jgi:hypothetical protein
MPVLVGGPPTISLMGVAMHLLGPLAKALGKTKAAMLVLLVVLPAALAGLGDWYGWRRCEG